MVGVVIARLYISCYLVLSTACWHWGQLRCVSIEHAALAVYVIILSLTVKLNRWILFSFSPLPCHRIDYILQMSPAYSIAPNTSAFCSTCPSVCGYQNFVPFTYCAISCLWFKVQAVDFAQPRINPLNHIGWKSGQSEKLTYPHGWQISHQQSHWYNPNSTKTDQSTPGAWRKFATNRGPRGWVA